MNCIAFLILLSQLAFANDSVRIDDRLATESFFKENYHLLFGRPEYALTEKFTKAVRQQTKTRQEDIHHAISRLDGHMPPKLLMPFLYGKYISNNHLQARAALLYQMVYKLLILRDFADDPTLSAEKRNWALNELRRLTRLPEATTDDFFQKAQPHLFRRAQALSQVHDVISLAQQLSSDPLFSWDPAWRRNGLPDYSLSFLGTIRGNKVQLISENDRSQDRMNWLNDRVIFNGGRLDWSAPHMKMPLSPEDSGHIVFQQDPIFIKIREMIDSAEDSIFIDIFLFGGTIGGTLSRHLIDETIKKRKKNPNFKALLLHDFATNYNMKPEMMPIFEYIRDRIKNEPEVAASVFLLQANIQRHPPGIPFGITDIIPKTKATFKTAESRNTYYESKIDHSKVIVVDAQTEHPRAYFGSKNWSDHSGGYYYDDAIYIEGPAAAVVQASYYDDIEAALTEDPKERAWMYFKEQGFGNDHYLSRKKEILSWIKIKRNSYPALGREPVRLAEANVDGKIKNVRNILIDMISKAQKRIYMEQLFIYDKYIVEALIKRKKQKQSLDIRILADHNDNFGMNGLPNTIFFRELADAGIALRARRTVGVPVVFPNGKRVEYHQENHRKITAVDGITLLGGSSNLNPDTLQGSFREFGAQIWSRREIARFEKQFLADWDNNELTMSLDDKIYNFRAKIGAKTLSLEASQLLNAIGAQLIRSKDDLEGRH